MNSNFAVTCVFEDMVPKNVGCSAACANRLVGSWVERGVLFTFEACVKLPIEKVVLWVASTEIDERVGCLGRKETGEEVEVFRSM